MGYEGLFVSMPKDWVFHPALDWLKENNIQGGYFTGFETSNTGAVQDCKFAFQSCCLGYPNKSCYFHTVQNSLMEDTFPPFLKLKLFAYRAAGHATKCSAGVTDATCYLILPRGTLYIYELVSLCSESFKTLAKLLQTGDNYGQVVVGILVSTQLPCKGSL